MSEKNLQKEEKNKKPDTGSFTEHALDLRINRAKNELSIRNPDSGELFTFKVNIDEIEEGEEVEIPPRKPLSAEEFQEVYQKIEALGLTWSADLLPQLKSKKTDQEADSAFISNELQAIRNAYPHFPSELGSVIFYVLAGKRAPIDVVGNDEELEKKAEFVRDALISPAYRSEFFFKHAIKVPYFADLDWEVVVKAYERGVKDSPGIAYALLSLQFRHPMSDPYTRPKPPQNLTVAVNERLVDRLMKYLSEVKAALQKTESMIHRPQLTENTNVSSKKTE